MITDVMLRVNGILLIYLFNMSSKFGKGKFERSKQSVSKTIRIQ